MEGSSSDFPFRKILVGLTATGDDRHLFEYARAVSESAGEMEFQFVHVDERPPGKPEKAARTAADVCTALTGDVREHFPADRQRIRTSCHVVEGASVDRLLEFAALERNDLILIGHRRVRSGRRSMARRLAMNAPCPVWMVPAGSPATISRVMATVDFSHHSAYALSVGTAVVKSRGLTECLALNVQFNQIEMMAGKAGNTLRSINQAEFEHFLRPLNLHGVTVRPVIEESATVARALLAAAGRERVDLLVMGTRGRSPSAAVLLGSETEQVIMESGIPVLIVKPLGDRASLLQAVLGFSRRNDPVLTH